jgi:hypothetical protein
VLFIEVDLLGLMINLTVIEIIWDRFVLLRLHHIFIFIRSLPELHLHPIALLLHGLLALEPLLLDLQLVHLQLLVHVLDLLDLLESQLLMPQTFEGLPEVVIGVLLLFDVRGNDKGLLRVAVRVFGRTLVVGEVGSELQTQKARVLIRGDTISLEPACLLHAVFELLILEEGLRWVKKWRRIIPCVLQTSLLILLLLIRRRLPQAPVGQPVASGLARPLLFDPIHRLILLSDSHRRLISDLEQHLALEFYLLGLPLGVAPPVGQVDPDLLLDDHGVL